MPTSQHGAHGRTRKSLQAVFTPSARGWVRVLGGAVLMTALAVFCCPGQPVRAQIPAAITSGAGSRPDVALTFDDGPSPRYTPQILTILRQYQARATFFVLGHRVEEHPSLIRAMLRDGHEVGNHTYSHARLPALPPGERARELVWTRTALDWLGCPDTRIMRPPYSDSDPRLLASLGRAHRQMILWNVDSGDWRGLPAGEIVANVLGQVKNGAIIIFHDSDEYDRADRTPTVQALELILPALRQAGYRLVTVSELTPREE